MSRYWMYGIHACKAAMANPKRIIHQIYLGDKGLMDELDIPQHHLKKVTIGHKKQLATMLGQDIVHQNVAISLETLPNYNLDGLEDHTDDQQIVVVLDQVTDPHNVGAILRSCSVFGVKALVTLERNTVPENGTLAKTASGALDVVPIIRIVNLAQALGILKKMGFWCIGLAEGGDKPFHQMDLKGKITLVLGSEGEGLRELTKKNCDFLSHLPTNGPLSTLNVSTAAAITIYQTFLCQGQSIILLNERS